MKYFEYCQYTYRHRQALRYLIEKLIRESDVKREMLRRADVHDIDKIIMYQFLSRKEASKIHKATATHHMANSIPKTYFDKLEAVLDYESAGYTKPDKPFNAFDTINRFKNDGIVDAKTCDELLEICEKYGLVGSYSVTKDAVGMNYLSQFEEVTEEMINEDIRAYFCRIVNE